MGEFSDQEPQYVWSFVGELFQGAHQSAHPLTPKIGKSDSAGTSVILSGFDWFPREI